MDSNRDVFTAEGDLSPEEQERRERYRQAAMQQAGERMETYVEPDYFGADDTHQFFLPGSREQFVMIKAFTEGDRCKYLDRTNRDLKLDRSGTASLKTAPGSDRHTLLKIAIVDFALRFNGQLTTMAQNPKVFERFLESAPPSVIDEIVKEVHKHNPWLLAEMSVEDIEKEISNLQEMLEAKKKEEALDAQF